MKDDIRAEQFDVCRQDIYKSYVTCYLQCTDVRPCRDACLLNKAARYLREPETRETFTMFPFYQSLSECCGALRTDCRKLLSAFIKAAELLETLCVNLFLQPWKKEIKTLKTYTGPFVYCLLPVLSSSTIHSVLASIGYLPHTDTPKSEFRLSDNANPDRAMLIGFELLLARVECYRLLELLDKDQLGPKEWLEVLQRRVGPKWLEPPTEKKKIKGEKDEVEENMNEDADRKEVPPCLKGTRLAVIPKPKPQCCHPISVDQSIIEMQMTYPDLAFRGRPLLTDKPKLANTSSSSSKTVHTASTNDCSSDSKTTGTLICSKRDGSKAAEVFVDNGRSSVNYGRNSSQTTTRGDTISSSFCDTDGSRDDDDEQSHPPAISLHITLRAGSTAEQRLKPGEPQPTGELWPQQQTTADLQSKRPANPGLPSLSSIDDGQELRELAERMGQLYVQETKTELKRKEEKKSGEEKTNRERRKKEKRKTSTEREAEELNLRRPMIETGAGLSHAASRCTRSSQSDAAVMKEQKQPTVCQPSQLTISTAFCQSIKGGSTQQQEGEDTERVEIDGREEEQLAQGYIVVEHHKK